MPEWEFFSPLLDSNLYCSVHISSSLCASVCLIVRHSSMHLCQQRYIIGLNVLICIYRFKRSFPIFIHTKVLTLLLFAPTGWKEIRMNGQRSVKSRMRYREQSTYSSLFFNYIIMDCQYLTSKIKLNLMQYKQTFIYFCLILSQFGVYTYFLWSFP